MNLGLIFTLLTGLFIIIGALIGYFTKKNKKVIDLSIGIAFGVMVCLSIFELFPESYEYIVESIDANIKYLVFVAFILIGILLLKGLDHFIPDHDHEPDNLVKDENLYHIGVVSSIALLLHNIIEGMTIYSTTIADSKMGILILLGVGLHNIPMGLVIYSTLSKIDNTKNKKMIYLILVSISTFIGGLIMFLIGNMVGDLIVGILLCLTLGMIIYIVVFELLTEMIESKNKKNSIIGIILGIILFLISLTFE